MSTYRVYFTQVISTSVEVEADSFGDAVEAAYDSEAMPSNNPLCAQCGGWGQPYSIDTGEWEPDETSYGVDGEYVEVTR